MRLPNYNEAKKREKKDVNINYDGYKTINKDIGKNKTYYIKTYGCQMNEHDSEVIAAILEEIGFTYEKNYLNADLIILNTCAIRENAHNKTFGYLGRIKNLKSKKPDVIVGIAGCMAQEEGVVDLILDKYKWMDFVIGTHNIHELALVLEEALKKRKVYVDVWENDNDIYENLPVKRNSKYKAWVNIMYGCDKFCTYCIVPLTRGHQRSRKLDDIIDEVNGLVKEGFKEVTLLGQNVNAYGKDLKDNITLANLLLKISLTGIDRIRFVTSHPWDFTDEMIDVIAKHGNIMPYIHLPVQSGSNDILKKMNRRYTKEEYIKLVNKIRNKIKNVSITTDIIIGFPNEKEKDFKETIDLVESLQFDGAFTFIYSPREGTSAAKIKDDVSIEEKNNRLQTLNQVINKYALINNKKLINKEVSVLIEGVSEKDSNILMGYTDTMKLVNVKGSKDNIGKIVKVNITDAKTWSLNGEINE